ncbi:MAG: hypothetical protein ACOC1K_05830 [Nanoarchaeota archaeon]
MKRGKIITVLLILAIFFSLLSIAISLSVDKGADYNASYNADTTDSNSAKVGLEVINEEESNSENTGDENGY